MPTPKPCYQCGADNPDQRFCGSCGSPLVLGEYIAVRVKDQLTNAIRDRDVLEMDSSIKVFEKALSWMKLIFGIAIGLLILAGGGVLWKVSDLWSSVDKAKQSVTQTATSSRDDIGRVTSQSRQDVTTALDAGKATIKAAADDAARQSREMKNATVQSRTEMSQETASFRSDLDASRQQLQAASKIQPEMASLQEQLTKATDEIQVQRKVLSSSEDFAKSVFSSHVTDIFAIGQPPKDRYAVVPPSTSYMKNTVVFLLLNKAPIQGTLQVQFYISLEPPNSYFQLFHNLIIFFWGDPPDNLQQKPLSVSYFPDTSDNELIHSLSQHDGRVWADDQPLPKFNEPDPDFKGNKWIPLQPSPAKP
jgi:hypothetical protein